MLIMQYYFNNEALGLFLIDTNVSTLVTKFFRINFKHAMEILWVTYRNTKAFPS